jgi:hypothetical protein
MRPKTKVQRLGTLLPSIPRPRLVVPHYSPGCRTDPTNGIDKATAAKAFQAWYTDLPPTDVTVFSDGSEQHVDGARKVGYGYASTKAADSSLPATVPSTHSLMSSTRKLWVPGEALNTPS